EAVRLDLGVDMATGTGWPFGGTWVGEADACRTLAHRTWTVQGGSRLTEPVQFEQPPFVRAIGKQLSINELKEPVEANANLQRFDRAFAVRPPRGIRAFFNDSYEVDDASGQADGTAALFREFEMRRGYDLKQHLPALFDGEGEPDTAARVLADYRQTVSDLLLDTFTTGWRAWAKRQGAIVRNQAHGSPASLLDLYAAS